MFDAFPIWLCCVVAAALVFGATECGLWFVKARIGSADDTTSAPRIESVVGAMLGLLALLMAFTFHLASSRFDQRKQMLLAEVNAIGTTFLRADFLPDPQRSETKELLQQYVAARLDLSMANMAARLEEAERLQTRLWAIAVSLQQTNMAMPLVPLYAASLNEVIDLHESRVVVGLQYRVPDGIWLGLAMLVALSMFGVGIQFGFAGQRYTGVRMVLALGFAIVVWLIADLDRPGAGMLSVSQQPLQDLQRQIGPTNR